MSWALAVNGLEAFGQVANSFAGYQQQKASAEYQEKLQDYRNKMVNLSAAQSLNTITSMEVDAVAKSQMQAAEIQKQGMQLEAQTELQAAATGTTGRTAELVTMQAKRTESTAEYTRQVLLKDTLLSYHQQRQNVEVARAMQTDNSWIQEPSLSNPLSTLVSAGLNFTGAYLDYYDTQEDAYPLTDPNPTGGNNNNNLQFVGSLSGLTNSVPLEW